MIETIRQGLKADGFDVSISKLCRWFDVPRRTMYYRPVKAAPKLQERFVTPIKAMIEENPSFRSLPLATDSLKLETSFKRRRGDEEVEVHGEPDHGGAG